MSECVSISTEWARLCSDIEPLWPIAIKRERERERERETRADNQTQGLNMVRTDLGRPICEAMFGSIQMLDFLQSTNVLVQRFN